MDNHRRLSASPTRLDVCRPEEFTMVAVTDALPRSGTRMSLDEWDALPETSIRLELIEGVLVVSPFPAEVHQRMVVGLMKALLPASPAELSVYNVPLPVRVPSRVSGLGPDLLVIRTADRELRDPMPALVVEVASRPPGP